MEKRDKEEMSRRKFLKIVGVSAAASAAALYGCASEGKPASSEASVLGEVPVDKMTYRVSPKGERVSLLGYGCMRWPLKPAPDSDGNVIDQDAVNELVDYAIAHGVNYFDTSPVYCQGFSERATGAALKRYPREKLLIATKMSNFQNYTRENSIKMYSMENRIASIPHQYASSSAIANTLTGKPKYSPGSMSRNVTLAVSTKWGFRMVKNARKTASRPAMQMHVSRTEPERSFLVWMVKYTTSVLCAF